MNGFLFSSSPKSTLEFELRYQEFIELVRARQFTEALSYSSKQLLPWKQTHMNEIAQVLTLLAFDSNTTCPPYAVSLCISHHHHRQPCLPSRDDAHLSFVRSPKCRGYMTWTAGLICLPAFEPRFLLCIPSLINPSFTYHSLLGLLRSNFQHVTLNPHPRFRWMEQETWDPQMIQTSTPHSIFSTTIALPTLPLIHFTLQPIQPLQTMILVYSRGLLHTLTLA